MWNLLRMSPQGQERGVEWLKEVSDVETYYPVYSRMVRPHGVRKAREEVLPVYPGYVFVNNLQCTQAFYGSPVRMWLVKFGGVTGCVSEVVIYQLRELERKGELVKEIKYDSPFVPGTVVRVHKPWGDVIGAVVKLSHNGSRVCVDTQFCRISVPVQCTSCM